MSNFQRVSRRKAKKEHNCEFCNRTIKPGETYSYSAGVYDGDFFVHKLCIPCMNMLDAFYRSGNSDEFDWWDVTDWLMESECYNCAHRAGEEMECQYDPQNCDIIRKKFE